MEKIASFTIDHLTMSRGIFVSRKDGEGDNTLTTFDLRMKEPNREPVIDNPALHGMEHLCATFLRNSPQADTIIYFGPMGCRTGNYLIVRGDLSSKDIYPLVKEMFDFVANYEGEIPGASAKDCGNYLDMNLSMAKWEAKRYLETTLNCMEEKNFTYPQ